MVKNFHLPTPPTNWLDSLDEANKDALQKLKERGRLIEKHGQQKIAATIGAKDVAASIGDVGKIAGFSVTAANIIDDKKQTQFEIDYRKLEFSDQEKLEQIGKEIDLTQDGNELKEKLKKSNLSDAAQELISKNSARNSLRLRRILGHDSVKNSISNFDQKIEGSEALQEEYDNAYQTNKVLEFYKKYAYNDLYKLGFNDKYIASHFKDEVERLAETKGALATLDYKIVISTKDIEEDIKIIEGLEKSGNKDDATSFLQELLQRTGSKTKTATFLHRLLREGKIHRSVIDSMQLGAAKKFEGGKVGEKLFDQKTWDFIYSGETKRENGLIEASKIKRNEDLQTGHAAYLESGNETDKQKTLAAYLAGGGKDTDDVYVALENTEFSNQTKAAYEAATETTTDIISSGKAEDYDLAIATTKNVRRKDELVKEKELYKKNRVSNGFNAENSDAFIEQLLVTKNQYNIAPGGKFPSGSPSTAKKYLSAKIDRIYKEVYDEVGDPKSKKVAETVKRRFEQELEEEGFNAKDNTDPRFGILTPTADGRYPGLELKVNSDAEFRQGDNPLTTARNIKFSWDNLEGTKSVNNLLLKKGSVLPTDELIAFSENSWNDAKGEITNWPPDILYKSELLGVMPSTLVKMQLEALVNSTDPADIDTVKRFGLTKVLENIPQADVKLRDFLEKNNARNLLNKYEYSGVRSLNSKDFEFITNLEKDIEASEKPAPPKRSLKDIEKEEKKLKEDLKRSQSKTSLQGKTLEEQMKIKLNEFNETEEDLNN